MEAPKHVIIVDDTPAIQDTLQIILERCGYKVITFSNGQSLLDGGFELPCLFIIDKQLPGMDGLDLCRHLKAQPSTRAIPLLILSASPHVGKLATSAGADGFLEKPFRMQDLRDTVERLLQRKG